MVRSWFVIHRKYKQITLNRGADVLMKYLCNMLVIALRKESKLLEVGL